MCLQDMIELCWSPTGTGFRQPISFVGKPQLILQIFSNPLSQLCRQPAQSRVSRPIYVLQPRWGGCFSVWQCQIRCRIGLRRLRSRRAQPEQSFEWAWANTMLAKCMPCTAEYIARYTEYMAVYTDTLWHITAFRHIICRTLVDEALQ